MTRSNPKVAAAEASGPCEETAKAERRLLTVLVCDLVGSTALAESHDPEDMRAIIAGFLLCCAETVEREGGVVAKYMGDSLLAFFGYPEARERDPEHAVDAGLAIVAAVPKLETPAGAPLHVRVGIATGLMVVGDLLPSSAAEGRAVAVVGLAANLAARLQAVAEPDSVVISDRTRRLLGGLYDVVDIGALALKGIDAPVQSWAVVSRSALENRFDALRGASLTAFVGRAGEIEAMRRLWSAAKSGGGAIVVLSGEAGIGKSRLVAEFLRGVADEPQFRLRFYCSPEHGDSALYPVIRNLEFLAGFAPEDPSTARLDKLDALLAMAGAEPEDASLFADLLSLEKGGQRDLPPERRREMIMAAIAGLIERLARVRPGLLVLEDAQWADPTTLELLGRLVAKVCSLSALVLVVSRPEFAPAWLTSPNVATIVLDRLSARETGLVVDGVVGEGALSSTARDEIVARAGGVPLFAEEIAKAALEAPRPGGGSPVPESLQASLAARLDRLGPAREVAQIAAAIGRECPQALLAAVAPDKLRLGEALETLVGAGILLRQGPPAGVTYVFKHALLQDLAYGFLLRERRRALHARIAEALEVRFPRVVDARPETLARHCAEAGLRDKAAALWGRAGRSCLRNSALGEAEAHFSRALATIRGQPNSPVLRREEIACQIGLARTLLLLRGYTSPEARAALDTAIALIDPGDALVEPVEHRLALFTTLHGFWLASIVVSSGPAARELAGQCLALAEKGGAKGEIVAARHAVGLGMLFSGDVLGSRRQFDLAIAMFDRAGDRRGTRYGGEYWSSALAGRAAALWTLGQPDAARADAAASLESARDFGHAMTLANNLIFAAWVQLACGHAAIAAAHAAEVQALADEKDEPYYRAFGRIMEGLAAVSEGGGAEAIARTSSAIIAYRATGATLLTAHALALLAKALAAQGRIDEARRFLDDAAATMAATEERWCEADIERVAGECALASFPRDLAVAERRFERALEIARAQGAKSWELRAATSLARLWGDGGRREEARALLAPVYGRFTEGFDTRDCTEAREVLRGLA